MVWFEADIDAVAPPLADAVNSPDSPMMRRDVNECVSLRNGTWAGYGLQLGSE